MVEAAVLTACIVLLPSKFAGQNAPHRLSKEDVVKLLKGQVSRIRPVNPSSAIAVNV